ncbi:Leucine-rich repeat domain L domain-like [Trinorchestia longiramus]|nr:Leucine-rich repeat domain L domain-like [Trinorchestia longiramus]
MSWRTAASLETLSSASAARTLIQATLCKIRAILQGVSLQVLRSHYQQANAKSSRRKPKHGEKAGEINLVSGIPDTKIIARDKSRCLIEENRKLFVDKPSEDTEKETTSCCHCPDGQEVCSMEAALHKTQKVLLEVKSFWDQLPKFGDPLCTQLDILTEVHPRHDGDFAQHLTKLCIKLVTLRTVFIDRDYDDRDKLCVVPCLWASWVADLIRSLHPLPTEVLSCYGALYPNIIESVLRAAPLIKELNLSHLNITDDLLVSASWHCSQLERMRLLHCYPWLVISPQGFAQAFFGEKSCETLLEGLTTKKQQHVKIKFRKLKELELSYGPVRTITDFHILLMCYYKNLKFIYSEWKSNFFDDGYENYCEDAIMEAIMASGAVSVDNLLIKVDYLHELSTSELETLIWNCPLLTALRIDCRGVRSRSSHVLGKRIGDQLVEIGRGRKSICTLHANVSKEECHTRAILLPFLLTRASSLTDVTLEACSALEYISVNFIKLVLETCPSIERLKIKVWIRSMVRLPSAASDIIAFPQRHSLREIWLHEDGPGESEGSLSICKLWLILLKSLLAAAPDIQSLSFTICEGLINVLSKLHSDVERLHVRILDGHEWQPSVSQFRSLIRNQPKLKVLFLEEVSGSLFWEMSKIFQPTQLQIFWGNFEGWPRS